MRRAAEEGKLKRQIALFALALLSSATALRSQDAPATAALLQHMAQQSADYRKNLPSFSCDETVTTLAKHKNKVQRRVEFRASIRVMRDAGNQLSEVVSLTSLNNQPVREGWMPPLPFNVSGGLSRAFPAFFVAEKQPCYRFSATPGRIDFTWRSGTPPCDEVPSTHGFTLLDDEHNILHAETRREPEEAAAHGFTSFTLVDYAPVPLNGTVYRLPRHLYAEMQRGEWVGTYEAQYANCKLFHATVTLGPVGTTPIQPPQ